MLRFLYKLLLKATFSKTFSFYWEDIPSVPSSTELLDRTVGSSETVPIPAYTLIVPVAITAPHVVEPPPARNFFPAKVDTGFNGNLALRDHHVRSSAWAGADLADLPEAGHVTATTADGNSHTQPLSDARLWLFSSDNAVSPRPVDLDGGFIYYLPAPDGQDEATGVPFGPRIPLLGANALMEAGLCLHADYELMRYCLINA